MFGYKTVEDAADAAVEEASRRLGGRPICTDMLYRGETYESFEALVDALVLDTQYWDGDGIFSSMSK